MIEILACDCGGAENLARTFIRECGYRNYMQVPMSRGNKAKDRAYEIDESLGNFLRTRSSFVIIVGTDGDVVKWSNISDNNPASRIQAELVVDRFA